MRSNLAILIIVALFIALNSAVLPPGHVNNDINDNIIPKNYVVHKEPFKQNISGMEINGYTFTSNDDCFQGIVMWSDVPFFKSIADSFMSSQGIECTGKKLNGMSYDECTSDGQVGYKYEYDGKIVILNCNQDMAKCNCDVVLYDFLNTKKNNAHDSNMCCLPAIGIMVLSIVLGVFRR
ncbi:hypothetical protein J7J90_02605 [Candidatus Micrarchaeota archaeon]|nr:hypothetical protein [Candidatus Micrarchaeota archaeon]